MKIFIKICLSIRYGETINPQLVKECYSQVASQGWAGVTGCACYLSRIISKYNRVNRSWLWNIAHLLCVKCHRMVLLSLALVLFSEALKSPGGVPPWFIKRVAAASRHGWESKHSSDEAQRAPHHPGSAPTSRIPAFGLYPGYAPYACSSDFWLSWTTCRCIIQHAFHTNILIYIRHYR